MIQLTQFLSLLALFGSSAAFSPLGSSPPELLGGSACRLLSPVTSRPSTPSAGLRGLRSELGEVQRTDTFASRHEPHRLRPRLSASSLYPEDSALYDEYYLDSTSEVGRKKQREGVWRHLFHMTRPKAIPGEIALSLVGSWLAVPSDFTKPPALVYGPACWFPGLLLMLFVVMHWAGGDGWYVLCF